MILDEPTNHLDVATVDALGKALSKFKVRLLYHMGEGGGETGTALVPQELFRRVGGTNFAC